MNRSNGRLGEHLLLDHQQQLNGWRKWWPSQLVMLSEVRDQVRPGHYLQVVSGRGLELN